MKVTKGQCQHRMEMLPEWVHQQCPHDPMLHSLVASWGCFEIQTKEELFERIARAHSRAWVQRQEILRDYFFDSPQNNKFVIAKEPTC